MHDGHRKRLLGRLQAEGADNFEAHQLLEALLFFSIPRADTNETAHRLIEHFGSLSYVFAADSQELMMVEGVGGRSASLIKLVGGIVKKVADEEINTRESFDSIGKITRYLYNLYTGLSFERVYMMMFDNGMHLLDCIHICDGTINSAIMTPRTMIEKALFRRASAVIVSHNHPHGLSNPSADDIQTTKNLIMAFDLVGINFLEHIVIAGKSYSTIVRYLRDADYYADKK